MHLTKKRKFLLGKTSDRINIFISGLLLLPIYIKFMDTLSQITPFSTKFSTYLYYGAMWFFLLSSVLSLSSRIIRKCAIVISILLTFLIMQSVIQPASKTFLYGSRIFDLITFQPKTLFATALYIVIGLFVTDYKVLYETMRKVARIGLVMITVSYVLSALIEYRVNYDDMSNAYAICIAMCVLIAKREKNDLYFLAIGAISLIIAGTRGPILCVLFAALLKGLLLERNLQRLMLRSFICLLCVFILYSGTAVWILDLISDGLSRIGISRLRIVDYIKDGMILDLSSRDEFASQVFELIKQNPIIGYGIGGDRMYLPKGRYVHNLVLECIFSMGIIFGGVVVIWMGKNFWKAMRSRDKYLQAIAIALFSGIVMKLMLSSSLIYSKELFLFIGICISSSTVKSYTESESGIHLEV